MARRARAQDPAASDPDNGIWRGQAVARRFVSPDGFVILVGRTAADNDILSFKLAAPTDFWLHAAGSSGAHVVVRNPAHLERLPRATLRFAAALAARHSGARRASRVAVHVTRCAELRKPRGLKSGTVTLKRYTTVHASPTAAQPPGAVDGFAIAGSERKPPSK